MEKIHLNFFTVHFQYFVEDDNDGVFSTEPARIPFPTPLPNATPVSAAPRITPKIVPRTASAAAKVDDDVVVPPSVKGRPAAPAIPAKKPTGARSADENGMLPMVPLNENVSNI